MKAKRFLYNSPGIILLFGIFMLLNYKTHAASYTAVTSGDWHNNSTWGTGAGVWPGAGDDVTIGNGYSVNINGTTDAAASIQLGNGSGNGIIGFRGTSPSLTVSGTITAGTGAHYGNISMAGGTNPSLSCGSLVNGGNANLNLNGGTMIFTGSFTMPSGANSFHNLTINSSGTITLSAETTVGGDLALTSGTLDASSFTMDIAGNITGTGSNFAAGSGTVNMNSSSTNQTIASGITFNNLTIDNTYASGSGTVTPGGSVTVNGILSMTSGSYPSGGITYGGSSSLVYNGTSAQVTGPEWPGSFGQNVTFDNTSPSGVTLGGYVMGYTGTITVTTILDIPESDGLNGSGDVNFSSGSTLITENTNASGLNGYITLTPSYSSGMNFVFDATSGAQVTGTNMPSTVANLTINNSSGLTLSAALTVSGALTLSSGTLALGSNNFTFASGSTIPTGSSSSYIKINGSGLCIADNITSATIPVGDEWAPVMISNGGGADYTIGLVNYVTGNGGSPTLSSDVVAITWNIQASTTESTVGLTFQWPSSSDLAPFSPATDPCFVAVRTSPTGTWTPGTSSMAGGSDPYTQSTTVSSMAGGTTYYFGIGGNASALPVSLFSFSAQYQNNHINLNWTTASEQNNAYFEVERSQDANNWSYIGRVQGNGTSNITHSYAYTDDLAGVDPAGILYYRLKQVDFNGGFTFSEIRPVSLSGALPSAYAFPNPASSIINVNWNNTGEGATVLRLIDMNGVSFYETTVAGQGSKQQQIDMSGLASGVYYLQVITGNQSLKNQLIYKY